MVTAVKGMLTALEIMVRPVAVMMSALEFMVRDVVVMLTAGDTCRGDGDNC